MGTLHEPRAHEQRNVNANRLIVQQTSRVSHRALRVRQGVRSRSTGAAAGQWCGAWGIQRCGSSSICCSSSGSASNRVSSLHRVL